MLCCRRLLGCSLGNVGLLIGALLLRTSVLLAVLFLAYLNLAKVDSGVLQTLTQARQGLIQQISGRVFARYDRHLQFAALGRKFNVDATELPRRQLQVQLTLL